MSDHQVRVEHAGAFTTSTITDLSNGKTTEATVFRSGYDDKYSGDKATQKAAEKQGK